MSNDSAVLGVKYCLDLHTLSHHTISTCCNSAAELAIQFADAQPVSQNGTLMRRSDSCWPKTTQSLPTAQPLRVSRRRHSSTSCCSKEFQLRTPFS